jgi:hypothetical protein
MSLALDGVRCPFNRWAARIHLGSVHTVLPIGDERKVDECDEHEVEFVES